MRIWQALFGVTVLAAFGYTVYTMRTNNGKLPWEASPQVAKNSAIRVPAGTPIELILLEGADAGGSREGDLLALGVLKDVRIQNQVVIPMGAKATAKVVESRGASLLNAVINRPARLAVELQSVEVAGKTISLVGADGKPRYQFTQENTADQIDAAKIDPLWTDAEARNALIAVAESTVTGKNLDSRAEEIGSLADRLGMKKTSELVAGKQAGLDLNSAITLVRSGRASSLSGIEAVMAAQAAGEIASLVSSVDHKVRGVFKGRTIRAVIGTRISAKTAEPATIAAPR